MALEQGLGSPSIHTSIFELFCRYGKPLQVRVGAAHKHTDSRPVRSRRLMMLTPTYLSTSPSEECPRANHTLFEPLPWNSSLAPPHWDTWLWGHSPLCPPFAWHSNKAILVFSSVQFSRSVMSDSLRPRGLQHARPPCPSAALGDYSNSCPLSRWCHPTISSSVVPFSSHL